MQMFALFETHKLSCGKTCSRSSVSVSHAGKCAAVPSQPLLFARHECAKQSAFANHRCVRGPKHNAAPVAPLNPSTVTTPASATPRQVRTSSASGKFQNRGVAASGARAVSQLQTFSLPNPSFESFATLTGTGRLRRPAPQLKLQGLPQFFNHCCCFISWQLPCQFQIALPQLCKKMEDCETTNGHIGHFARTLMKDARRGLNR